MSSDEVPNNSGVDEPQKFTFPDGAEMVIKPRPGSALTNEQAVFILEMAKQFLVSKALAAPRFESSSSG